MKDFFILEVHAIKSCILPHKSVFSLELVTGNKLMQGRDSSQ